MVKRIGAVCAALSFCFTAVGQNIEGINGRLDAMAGSGAIDDIGWAISHPASIYKFPNQIQGTSITTPIPSVGETFGAIIGIMQFSDMLYAGFTLNNRMYMPAGGASGFYSEAWRHIAARNISLEETMKDMANLPELNLCLKLSENVVLGVGGFFEEASETNSEKLIGKYALAANPADTAKVLYDRKENGKSIRCDGVNAEARLTVAGLTLYPQANVGFPRVTGSLEREQIAAMQQSLAAQNAGAPVFAVDSSVKYYSTATYYRAGSHAWGEIGKTLLIGGVFWKQRSWQFSKDLVVDTVTLSASGSGTVGTQTHTLSNPSHKKDQIDVWFAIVPYYSDGLYISPEYDGGIELTRNRGPNDLNPDSTQYFIYNNFRLGVEKVAKDVWVFDEFALRCGVVAYWNKEIRKIKNNLEPNAELNQNMTWKSFFWGSDFAERQAKVTFGFGIKKGRGTFDVSFNMVKWKGMGSLSGPPPALATLTVDFGKKTIENE